MLIILLQLYWLSFGLIGLTAVLLLRRLSTVRESEFIRHLRTTHPALQAVVLFVIGLLVLTPVIVASYVFEWPLLVLAVFYVAALLASIVGVVIWRKELAGTLRLLTQTRLRRSTFVFGLAAGAVLLFDFIVSLKVGGPLYGDVPVQLAKINFFQHVHVTLADPYFSAHGVVDPRYSTNLLDAYQAVAANLLHMTALQVWSYSYGAYRLVIWLSLFSLVWSYLGKKYRHLAYVLLITAPIIWSGYFLFAELPDRIVLAWTMLFLIGLQWWLRYRSWPLLVIATVLIATTHALYAGLAIGYLGLVLLALWVSRTMQLKRMTAPIVCIVLLSLPVGLDLYYPNYTRQDADAFNAGSISGVKPQLHHYGSLLMVHLPAVPYTNLMVYALFVAYMWLAYKLRRRSLQWTAYGAAFLGTLFVFSADIFAFVGYGLILHQVKQRAQRIAIGVLLCYYVLIAYNPLFWHIEAGKVPTWMVARFQELNGFALVAPMLGMLFLVEYPLAAWGRKRLSYAGFAVVTCLFLFYFTRPTVNDYSIATIWDGRTILMNNERVQSLTALRTLAPALAGQRIYSNDPNLSIDVPAVMVANVYSYNPQNESPTTDIVLRQHCSVRLAHTMRLSDLEAADITRVVTDSVYGIKLAKLARSRPYLSLIASSQDYEVYAVRPDPQATKVVSSCTVPFGQ